VVHSSAAMTQVTSGGRALRGGWGRVPEFTAAAGTFARGAHLHWRTPLARAPPNGGPAYVVESVQVPCVPPPRSGGGAQSRSDQRRQPAVAGQHPPAGEPHGCARGARRSSTPAGQPGRPGSSGTPTLFKTPETSR
jgi:hypothetical protein